MTSVLLFIGYSQYQSLNGMAYEIANAFNENNDKSYIIDTRITDHPLMIKKLIENNDIDIIITISGFGLDISKNDNLYKNITSKFFSLYFDPLLYYLEQINIDIPGRVITTTSDTDVDYWKSINNNIYNINHLPHAATLQVSREWSARTIPILFSGTGLNHPDDIKETWSKYDAVKINLLNRILEEYFSSLTPYSLTLAIFRAIGEEINLTDPWVLRSYYIPIDQYLRAWFRWRMVASLAGRPLLVVGEGWRKIGERLRALGPVRVRFQRPVNIGEFYNLASRTQICLNDCTPHHGSHERVFRAMAAGALAVTNRTRWFTAQAPENGLVQVDLMREDLGAVVDALLADPVRAAALAEAGRNWFKTFHTWSQRVKMLENWDQPA